MAVTARAYSLFASLALLAAAGCVDSPRQQGDEAKVGPEAPPGAPLAQPTLEPGAPCATSSHVQECAVHSLAIRLAPHDGRASFDLLVPLPLSGQAPAETYWAWIRNLSIEGDATVEPWESNGSRVLRVSGAGAANLSSSLQWPRVVPEGEGPNLEWAWSTPGSRAQESLSLWSGSDEARVDVEYRARLQLCGRTESYASGVASGWIRVPGRGSTECGSA